VYDVYIHSFGLGIIDSLFSNIFYNMIIGSINKILFYCLLFWTSFSYKHNGHRTSHRTNKIQSIVSRHSSPPSINGFYGLIGPKVNFTQQSTLFDLFTGNGIIQGVFISNGKAHYVQHMVDTDILEFQKRFGVLYKHVFLLPLFLFLFNLKLLPNILGVANTSFLKVKHKVYSLFERDLPYIMDINAKNETIRTIQKQPIEGIRHFSGHSKYDPINQFINTIEYDYIRRTVTIYRLFPDDFKIHSHKVIKTRYIPITHDYMVYGVLQDSILFCDSPLVIHPPVYFKGLNRIPLVLNHEKPTYIHTYNFTDGNHQIYQISERGYYIFHFSQIKYDDHQIEIYTPLYDTFDFNNVNIHAKYKRIVLDKTESSGKIHECSEIDESYNLDFPIPFNNSVILRNIKTISENKTVINGFVILEEQWLKQTILYDELCFCGEPAIAYNAEGIPFLLSFAYDHCTNEGYVVFINLNTYCMVKQILDVTPFIGFHSCFISLQV